MRKSRNALQSHWSVCARYIRACAWRIHGSCGYRCFFSQLQRLSNKDFCQTLAWSIITINYARSSKLYRHIQDRPAEMASTRRHSYVDIFGDKLPSRFPVPAVATRGVGTTESCTASSPSGSSLRLPLRKRVKFFFTNVWDSRIAMKFFGSRKELEMEEERLQNIEYIVIHPCSKFRLNTE